MSWKEKMKEYGGGDFAFLSEDGEVITFVVVDEPILLEGRFKGRLAEKIGCPIITEEGFTLFVSGKRLARKIAKHEESFGVEAFMAIRHGEQNDITATYELKVCQDRELTALLLGMVKDGYHPDMTKEAVVAALEVMKQ